MCKPGGFFQFSVKDPTREPPCPIKVKQVGYQALPGEIKKLPQLDFIKVFYISIQVPASFRRLGTQQASHINYPVSIPPVICNLQSFTTWAISWQAPLILPSLASNVAKTDSARPQKKESDPAY